MYGGPWLGYYESTLIGPGAYWFNSYPVSGSHNCNKLLPIMGPSFERTVNEAVHNFTHRTESTMKKVYGSWNQNNTSHNWNKFALVKAQSPGYSYSGCGNSHYPPNGTRDYDYTNSSVVLSNCEDFKNYPNLSDPLQIAQSISCTAWNCLELEYYKYWFEHFPAFPACGPDNKANDWWVYIAKPAYALYPANACQANMHFISGNAGIGNAILSYEDNGSKSVGTDTVGNYFLMVSNHWSGTVTPSKTGYIFTPPNMNYSDVQTDQNNQNYTATITTYTISGNTGIGDVTLSYADGTPKTITSDSNGNYSFVVPYNWSGRVTPAKTGFQFSPASKNYSAVRANQIDQNFSALVAISGNAGASSVVMSYTDGTPKTVTTDSSGNYSLPVSYNWSGRITPSRAGYTFSPVSKNYTNIVKDQTNPASRADSFPTRYECSG